MSRRNLEQWSAFEDPSRVIYDITNAEEIRVRNPMAFSGSVRIPLALYAEPGAARDINAAFHRQVQQAGKPCELVPVPGDHMSMVTPAVEHAIQWYRRQIRD